MLLTPITETKRQQAKDFGATFKVACSTLRDSRARWIEKAEHKNKTGGNWGEKGRFFFFSRPTKFSRAFYFCIFPTIWEPGTGYNYLKGSDMVFILYRLTPEDIKEGVTIPLKFVMFQNVASLMVSKVKS